MTPLGHPGDVLAHTGVPPGHTCHMGSHSIIPTTLWDLRCQTESRHTKGGKPRPITRMSWLKPTQI